MNLAPARKDGQDKDSVLLETSAGPEHRSPRVAGVSYDIYFLKRDPGQSWEEAMDALEAQDTGPEVLIAPQNWDQVSDLARLGQRHFPAAFSPPRDAGVQRGADNPRRWCRMPADGPP
jgi:hypothetical protein